MPSDKSIRGKAIVRHGPPTILRGGRNSGGGNDAPLGVPPIRGAGSFVLSPAPLAIPTADRSKNIGNVQNRNNKVESPQG